MIVKGTSLANVVDKGIYVLLLSGDAILVSL